MRSVCNNVYAIKKKRLSFVRRSQMFRVTGDSLQQEFTRVLNLSLNKGSSYEAETNKYYSWHGDIKKNNFVATALS